MAGYIANIFSEKTKIPESLFMIIIGLLIGPIFGLINPADFRGAAGIFATLAIVIILIDSGLEFDISALFKKMFDAALFTILVNVLITLSVGFFVHYVFGWNLLHGFLLGIVSSGTTTVMVQVLLDGLNINRETKHLLVLESILNDTTLILIAVSLISIIKQGSVSILDSLFIMIQSLLVEFSIGLLFAIIFFSIWFKTVKQIPPHKKRNYVFILGLIFVLYGVTEFFGGSGVMAALFFSLLLGNIHLIMKTLNLKEKYYRKEHIQSLRSIKLIQLDFSFFIRTFFFVFLGMITDLSLVTLPLLYLMVAILAIMISTRYISVRLISFIEHKYRKHAFLISTMVPRGFVATLLAFLPYNEGIIIPAFAEIVLLLIFATSLVSIFGTIIFRTKDEEKLEKKEKKKTNSH